MNLLSLVLSRLAQTSLLLTFVVVGAVASAQTVTYFHNDAFGTPVLATDANGNVVWKENYRPYGERLNNPSAEAGNAIGFTGKPFDPTTGLSYMGARYYNPMLGRFMGVDPAPGNVGDLHSFNRYAYANNNPYKFVDPDGRSPALAIEVGGPLLVGGAIYYATQTPERQQAMRASLGQFFDNLTRSVSANGQGQKQEAASGADSGSNKEGEADPRAGKKFTPKGKREVKEANAAENDGELKCEGCEKTVVNPKQHQKGVSPPGNEAHVDHIEPRSKGGAGSPPNGQVLCRTCNLGKSNN